MNKLFVFSFAFIFCCATAVAQNTATFYTLPGNNPGNLANSIVVDSNDCQWIGTNYCLIKKSGSNYSFITTGDGLPVNQITCLFEDNQGNLWIGTPAGVCRKSGSAITTFNVSDGLPSPNITAICQDLTGRIWIGTAGGVAVQSGVAWQAYTTADGLPSNDVRAIFCDAQDDIWIGTNGNGMAKFTNNTWATLTATNNFCIYAIQQDASGTIYAGGMDPATNGMLIKQVGNAWTTEILSGCGDFVNDLALDDNGNLWVSWFIHDICFLNGTQWYNFSTSNTSGWPGGLNCRAIDFDSQGQAWVAIFGTSTGQGLMRLNINMVSVQDHPSPAIRTYPNPATDIINIENAGDVFSYCILDQLGNTVIHNQSTTGVIPIHSLPAGLYYISIKTAIDEVILPLVKSY